MFIHDDGLHRLVRVLTRERLFSVRMHSSTPKDMKLLLIQGVLLSMKLKNTFTEVLRHGGKHISESHSDLVVERPRREDNEWKIEGKI